MRMLLAPVFLKLPVVSAIIWATSSSVADQPQWGQRHSRNMVSDETGLPDQFTAGRLDRSTGSIDLSTAENVRWVAPLGTRVYATPVVAEGKVLVGTNNGAPRDPATKGDRGVLMCFDERTGKFLWQLVVPKKADITFWDSPHVGITSSASVEDGRVYVVSNRGEVLCLDLRRMESGSLVLDGDLDHGGGPEGNSKRAEAIAGILWRYHMPDELGVRQHDSANCSVLLDGDLLYVTTANGVDVPHTKVPKPDAPALIALDKHTGRLVAREDFGIGARIVHGQWSSPALGEVGQRKYVFFGAGNGCLYACERIRQPRPGTLALNLKPAWYFQGDPRAQTEDDVPVRLGHGSRSYEVVGSPVFYRGRLYVAFTQDPWVGRKEGWLACIDARGSGNVTRTHLVWSHKINHCISTPSIVGDLLFLADHEGEIHCLNADTGEPYWVHDAEGSIWGSTLAADGKLYVGTARRTFWVLAADRQKRIIRRITMHDPIYTTPVAANRTLYVATSKHLYAIEAKQP